MRILFSFIGLLVILGIVVFTARQQLSALAPAPSPSSNQPSSGSANPPQQTIQQAQDEVQRALQQGAARASEADN